MVSAVFGKLTLGDLFELPRLRKELLRPRSHTEVFRQIHPTNHTIRIDQEFSWPRNIVAVDSCLRVHQVIGSNRVRIRIGKKWKRKTCFS